MDNTVQNETISENPTDSPQELNSENSSDSLTVPASQKTQVNIFSAIFNGMGIGLLLGLLLGLSISPVVSGVIATISSMLAVLIGLNERFLDPLKSIRIGAFGLFAVAGILGGIYMRANDPFAPTLADKRQHYLDAGFTDEEAKSFLTSFILSDTGQARREANVLYSSTVDADACDELQYADAETPLEELKNTFNQAGGTWKEFAESFSANLPAEHVSKALLAIRDSFCDLKPEGKITVTNLGQIKKISSSNSVDEIEEKMKDAGGVWAAIVTKISGNFSSDERKPIYLLTIKILSHE